MVNSFTIDLPTDDFADFELDVRSAGLRVEVHRRVTTEYVDSTESSGTPEPPGIEIFGELVFRGHSYDFTWTKRSESRIRYSGGEWREDPRKATVDISIVSHADDLNEGVYRRL